MTLHSETDEPLLPGFERAIVPIDDKPIQAVVGGSGPPLLMLHGDPQTHLCWHRIAPPCVFPVTVARRLKAGESAKSYRGLLDACSAVALRCESSSQTRAQTSVL